MQEIMLCCIYKAYFFLNSVIRNSSHLNLAHVKHNPGAMEKLFAGYVNARLDSYLMMLEIS